MAEPETSSRIVHGYATMPKPQIQATADIKYHLASHFMGAAVTLARHANKIELEQPNDELDNFFNEILGSVTGCIVMSMTAMEANLTEALRMYAEGTLVHVTVGRMSEEQASKAEKLVHRTDISEKYKDAAKLFSSTRSLDKGVTPWSDFQLLKEVRDSLVHFKPEWATNSNRQAKIRSGAEPRSHAALSKRLEGKFEPSRFVKGGLLFPIRMNSYDCARWAVNTCVACAASFQDDFGIQNNIAHQRTESVLP
jgi:hypothetical protein